MPSFFRQIAEEGAALVVIGLSVAFIIVLGSLAFHLFRPMPLY